MYTCTVKKEVNEQHNNYCGFNMYMSMTHNVSWRASRDSSLAGVGVGSSENVPKFGDDSMLPERIVVFVVQSEVTDETHQCLLEGG